MKFFVFLDLTDFQETVSMNTEEAVSGHHWIDIRKMKM